MPDPVRVACVGEAMVELSSLDAPSGAARVGVAGDTLNAAVYLAREMGSAARVAYLTALGEDPFSDRMLAFMAREALDTGLVARLPGRLPGLYAISVDARGERTFSYWRGESAARAMLGPGGLDLAALDGFDLVLLSGITLAILPPADRARLVSRCRALKAAGRRVAFDSNLRPRLWESLDAARDAFDAMWEAATIALPSRDDEARLRPDEGVDALFARLAGAGVAEVALKDGAAGPWLWADGRALPKEAYPPAPAVVDTTAAGDAFDAGYLAARLRGRGVAEAARAGHALAARVVGARGAIIARD